MISALPLSSARKASLLPWGTSMVLVKPSLLTQKDTTGSISLTKRTAVIFLTMKRSPCGADEKGIRKISGKECVRRCGESKAKNVWLQIESAGVDKARFPRVAALDPANPEEFLAPALEVGFRLFDES